MSRLRPSSVFRQLSVPQLRRRASNSVSAIQDTYFSTKDIFERHKVVFTVATSIASVATAWIGYTLRHYHESRVEQRLDSIETAMKNKYEINDREFKKLVSGTVSIPACVATAGTTLVIGYGLGWRGGRWYSNRQFRREQMKLLGQIKPKRWPLRFLRRPLIKPRLPESASSKASKTVQHNASPVVPPRGGTNIAC
ncbi:hypothetical protein Leryth_025485 [Lithospermum erythrorhizon]|nr:hypothetical protein Leryth_025485 [Lithospermum erythrorhizon]